jgi:hypothetical protein
MKFSTFWKVSISIPVKEVNVLKLSSSSNFLFKSEKQNHWRKLWSINLPVTYEVNVNRMLKIGLKNRGDRHVSFGHFNPQEVYWRTHLQLFQMYHKTKASLLLKELAVIFLDSSVFKWVLRDSLDILLFVTQNERVTFIYVFKSNAIL